MNFNLITYKKGLIVRKVIAIGIRTVVAAPAESAKAGKGVVKAADIIPNFVNLFGVINESKSC